MESKTIALKLTNQNLNNVVPLISTSAVNSRITVNSLRAVATINNIPSANLPDFSLEDSETERLYKALNIEWGSPRIQMNLYIGNTNGWLLIGAVSLINQMNVPFRNYNLIPLYSDKDYIELGNDTSLAVQMTDVGYGLLSGEDFVVIHGFYIQETPVQYSQSFSIPITQNSQIISASNSERKYTIITNKGNSEAFLSFGSEAFLNQGIPLLAGGSYELTQDINYFGDISAIAVGNTTLIGLESF